MTTPSPTAPQVGDLAPDFTLPSTGGEPVTLSSYRGHKNVVLVFYPLDFSPVCSMQLPEYSGRQDDFAEVDAVVLGINRDSLHTHKAWAAEYGIEVPLLADMKLDVARSYGVEIEDRAISGRAVFLIDKAGKLRFRFVEEKAGDYTLRPGEVLKKIREL
ncbi:peroxiredoxin [Deinococcus rubellus]|uniref:Peroxiredoxin n=1 Tax=Deinococcus rubellus TaxID=1889240 RepID=A0ABY5YJK4_9DEIO|nr:peroxiredoxin [Deinococcus rubellus]UWX64272.1 peroxiredoxin [Deinococcus rubellus]